LAKVVQEVRTLNPGIAVELLAGDFRGMDSALSTILEKTPEVFAHNIETVERLTPRVRDARASYRQSLTVLKRVKQLATSPVYTKSALMLGLGESLEEVEVALKDLRDHDVDFVTIGQYMRPTKKHLSIKRFVTPEEFKILEVKAQELGFLSAVSGPLVRSSYRAREFYERAALASKSKAL
jgi:lipoic acid synthetase